MTSGGTVHLDIAIDGRGDPLVFTHGWLDSRDVWRPVVARLGDDVRSVTWSLRGHGESATPPAGSYTRQHVLEDLDRVVSAAGRPVVLVGHSLGGYLSLAYNLAHPNDVRGLVLIAAGPGFRNAQARERWNASVGQTARRLGVPAGSEEISKHVDAWVIDALDTISTPTLVIVGSRDERFASVVGLFERHLDVRSSVVVEGAGHRVHEERPDEVAAAISRFLQELTPR